MEKKLRDNALSTLEDTAEYMGIDMETADTLTKNNIIRQINAASAFIESMTGRRFGRQRYVEEHYPSGLQSLCVDQYPILSVERITDLQTGTDLPADSYSIVSRGDIGVIHKDDGWTLRGYPVGLSMDRHDYCRYLQVEYTAGYVLPKDATEENPETLPYDLQMIVWQMVQQQWNLARNGANGLAAFSISDVSWTFDKGLGAQVEDIILQYRRICV